MKISVTSMIEAVLFASGEPLELSKIADALGLDEHTAKTHIEEYAKKLETGDSALCVFKLGKSYQLATKIHYEEIIKKVLDLKRNTVLSQAAMEVLAIIAYNQPVTRAFIEQVRGVDSSSVVTSLAEKGLVEEKGRLQLPGRPLSYGTTANFLRCFSLADLTELPQVGTDAQRPNPDNIDGQIEFE